MKIKIITKNLYFLYALMFAAFGEMDPTFIIDLSPDFTFPCPILEPFSISKDHCSIIAVKFAGTIATLKLAYFQRVKKRNIILKKNLAAIRHTRYVSVAKIWDSAIWDYENLAITKEPAAEVYILLSTQRKGS